MIRCRNLSPFGRKRISTGIISDDIIPYSPLLGKGEIDFFCARADSYENIPTLKPGTFILEPDFVGDQSYKFGVGRLSLAIADRISKQVIDGVHFAAAPGHLDCMADCALNTARRSFVALCDAGV